MLFFFLVLFVSLLTNEIKDFSFLVILKKKNCLFSSRAIILEMTLYLNAIFIQREGQTQRKGKNNNR